MHFYCPAVKRLHLDFGPGVLACAIRGGGRSEAGYCFHQHIVPGVFLFVFIDIVPLTIVG